MKTPQHAGRYPHRQDDCENALSQDVTELIENAGAEGWQLPEVVQAIVKISHRIYLEQGRSPPSAANERQTL